jgi:hypothetical protein
MLSGTFRVVFPMFACVPLPSHYHRMDRIWNMIFPLRLTAGLGQMSTTRRRQGLLSRGRLGVITKFSYGYK